MLVIIGAVVVMITMVKITWWPIKAASKVIGIIFGVFGCVLVGLFILISGLPIILMPELAIIGLASIISYIGKGKGCND